MPRERDILEGPNRTGKALASSPSLRSIPSKRDKVGSCSYKPRFTPRAKRACAACNASKVACRMPERGRPCQRCERKDMICVDYQPKAVIQRKRKKKEKCRPQTLKDKDGNTVKRLRDELNVHRGQQCPRNPWCVRPLKHPGHCGECKCYKSRKGPHRCDSGRSRALPHPLPISADEAPAHRHSSSSPSSLPLQRQAISKSAPSPSDHLRRRQSTNMFDDVSQTTTLQGLHFPPPVAAAAAAAFHGEPQAFSARSSATSSSTSPQLKPAPSLPPAPAGLASHEKAFSTLDSSGMPNLLFAESKKSKQPIPREARALCKTEEQGRLNDKRRAATRVPVAIAAMGYEKIRGQGDGAQEERNAEGATCGGVSVTEEAPLVPLVRVRAGRYRHSPPRPFPPVPSSTQTLTPLESQRSLRNARVEMGQRVPTRQ